MAFTRTGRQKSQDRYRISVKDFEDVFGSSHTPKAGRASIELERSSRRKQSLTDNERCSLRALPASYVTSNSSGAGSKDCIFSNSPGLYNVVLQKCSEVAKLT